MGEEFFSDAPDSLSGIRGDALRRLQDLLRELAVTKTTPELTTCQADGSSVELIIRHSEEDFALSLYVTDELLLVSWGELSHEDFTVGEYPSPVEALDDALGFARQALIGRLEVRYTKRGARVTKTETFWIDDNGGLEHVGTTGLLLFNPLARRTNETINISFL